MNRVVNATVLANFAAVGQLDMLRLSAGPLFLPEVLLLEAANTVLAAMIVRANYRSPITDLGELLR